MIGYFSDTKMVGRFSRTNTQFSQLFKKLLPHKAFLERVMDANLDKLKHFLLKPPDEVGNMILKRVPGIELSGSSLDAVSSLEFAAGAGDMEIVRALLAYVPKDKKPEALDQLKSVRAYGLAHGKFMAPYHALINKCKNSTSEEHSAEYRVTVIGGAQGQLPVFGLQFLFDKSAYSSIAHHRSIDRYKTPKGKSLQDLLSNLGKTCLITKPMKSAQYSRRCCDFGIEHPTDPVITNGTLFGRSEAQSDSINLRLLCEASEGALDGLILRLQSEIDVTLTPTPSNSK